MTIHYMPLGSSILDSPANALVCPVNCVPGVMGAGLAKAFADRWPGLKAAHRAACNHPRAPLRPGRTTAYVTAGDNSRMIVLAPTKDHWRDPSRLEWVAAALADIGRKMDLVPDRTGVLGSFAVPALGCGLGGLSWDVVEPLILQLAARRPDVAWSIYPPPVAARP